jgi:hypothetical protein
MPQCGAEDDRNALLFTAPSGGALRHTNWLRRTWYPATISAGLGRTVEDEGTDRPQTRRGPVTR